MFGVGVVDAGSSFSAVNFRLRPLVCSSELTLPSRRCRGLNSASQGLGGTSEYKCIYIYRERESMNGYERDMLGFAVPIDQGLRCSSHTGIQ